MNEEPQFLRFVSHGKVHVLWRLCIFTPGDSLHRHGYRGINPDDEIGLVITARQQALCGKVAPTFGLHGISAFPDELLCIRCTNQWPFDRVLLFEHPILEA